MPVGTGLLGGATEVCGIYNNMYGDDTESD